MSQIKSSPIDVGEIIGLEPGGDKVFSLRDSAMAGDKESLKSYVIYSIWRSSLKSKFKKRQIVKLLSFLDDNLEVNFVG